MVEIGRFNTLTVVKIVDFGVYLDGGERGEILMPKEYVPANCFPDDEVKAFVYFDSEDRIVATTEHPHVMVGEFAFLKVVALSPVGAFLDWGLRKDLLVPFREQRDPMIEGKSYLAYSPDVVSHYGGLCGGGGDFSSCHAFGIHRFRLPESD